MTFSKGFTLVELLVVIVIIGIMGMIILPNFATGSDGTRLRTASRGVIQMVRYARTMAVLQQTPMALVISSTGEVRVEPRGGSGGTPPADVAETAPAPESDAADDSGGGGKGYELAELGASKTYERVFFRVELDEAALDEEERGETFNTSEAEGAGDDSLAQAATLVRIPFESNGRCLPFVVRVRVGDVEDSSGEMTVAVDRFGVAKIVDKDE
jgi:prepilin-type N-terminal cleavage/methylation domain-containing protein